MRDLPRKRTSTLYVHGRHSTYTYFTFVRTYCTDTLYVPVHHIVRPHYIMIVRTPCTHTLYVHVPSHCTYLMESDVSVRRILRTWPSLTRHHFLHLAFPYPTRCRRVTFKVCLASFAICWPLDWARGGSRAPSRPSQPLSLIVFPCSIPCATGIDWVLCCVGSRCRMGIAHLVSMAKAL